MTEPMRIKAQSGAGQTSVRILMNHVMESGQRKDDSGKTVPAWHIQEVSAFWNGKVVMTAQWGPGVSKNPYLQFFIKGGKPGDKIAVTWTDTKGESRSDEAVVS